MSTPAISTTSGLFSGYTKLSKGLAVLLVGTHTLAQISPVSISYLALIPARIIPLVWNLITAGYIEQTIYGAIISTIGLLILGKLLEPLWGSREFLKFVFVVNFITFVSVFVTIIALYYITTLENYLYMPISGFAGALSGLLVGIKQIMPDQELPLLRIKAKWLPSIVLFLSVASSFFVTVAVTYLPLIIFGTYMGWIYLRYLQKKPEMKSKGDPSDDFAFSSFFPEVLRPAIDPISSLFARMLCGRSDVSNGDQSYTHRSASLSGSDSTEANRRRERGARALEERLAADILPGGSNADESQREATQNV